MSRLWIYLERTVVLQGAAILVFVVVVLTHTLMGHTLPAGIWIVLGCVLGLWFGMLSQFNLRDHGHAVDREGGQTRDVS